MSCGFVRVHTLFIAGVCKTEEDEGPSTEEDSQSLHGVGVCKWFNVRMGFGFLSMTSREGVPLDEPVDVFVHQVGCLPRHGHCKYRERKINPKNTAKRGNVLVGELAKLLRHTCFQCSLMGLH